MRVLVVSMTVFFGGGLFGGGKGGGGVWFAGTSSIFLGRCRGGERLRLRGIANAVVAATGSIVCGGAGAGRGVSPM